MITFVSDIHCSDELIGDCQLNRLNKAVNPGHVNMPIIFSSILFSNSVLFRKAHK